MTDEYYFVVEDKAMLATCKEWRAKLMSSNKARLAFAKSLGSSGYNAGFDNQIIGLRPVTPPPTGWHTPKPRTRSGESIMVPIKGKKGDDARAALNAIEKPMSIWDHAKMIDHPCMVNYTTPNGGGGSTLVGRLPNGVQLGWTDDTFIIVAPNPSKQIKEIKERCPDCTITQGDWKPPAGLREITKAECDLIFAQAKVKEEKFAKQKAATT